MLYSEKYFNGASLALNERSPSLITHGFNDLAKSMKIQWDPYAPVITVNSPVKAAYKLNEQAAWDWSATDQG
jgi:hypothetical protein